MTRKLKDLRDFIDSLKARGYNYEIPVSLVKTEVAEKFGTSPFVFKTVMNELETFGLLFPTESPALFRLTREKTRRKKLTKKEIEDMDKILES